METLKWTFLAILFLTYCQRGAVAVACSSAYPSCSAGTCVNGKPCVLNPAGNNCQCPNNFGACGGNNADTCTTIGCLNTDGVNTLCKVSSSLALSAPLFSWSNSSRDAPSTCSCPPTCSNKNPGACPSGTCPATKTCYQGIQTSSCGCRIPQGQPCSPCDTQPCVDGSVCKQITDANSQVTYICTQQVAGDPCNCGNLNCPGSSSPALYCNKKESTMPAPPACGYCSATKAALEKPCTTTAQSCASDFCDGPTGLCKVKAGNPCTTGSPTDSCETGYTCVGPYPPASAGTCKKPVLNENCHPAGPPCAATYVCQGSEGSAVCKSDTGNTCTKVSSSANEECKTGTICTGTGPTGPGTCQASAPTVGQHCYTSPPAGLGCQNSICDPYDKTCKYDLGAACDCKLGDTQCRHGSNCKQVIVNGYVSYQCTEQGVNDPCDCTQQYCGTDPGNPLTIRYCLPKTGSVCGCSTAKQANNGPCTSSAQCSSGLCQGGFCKVGYSGPCNSPPDPEVCQAGTQCTGPVGVCKYSAGQPCPGGDGDCYSNNCGDDNICKLNVGDSCTTFPTPPFDYCPDGYQCSASTGGTCKVEDQGSCTQNSDCVSNECFLNICAS